MRHALLIVWLAGCPMPDPSDDTGVADTGERDTADSADTAASDDTGLQDSGSDSADTADPETPTPRCLDGIEAATTLFHVEGELHGAWSCHASFIEHPVLRFEDVATGALVASWDSYPSTYEVALPAGTFRVTLDGCGLREQSQTGGTFLVEEALVVQGDLQRDLAVVGADRTGTASSAGDPLDSGWAWELMHFFPVSGDQVPVRAIERVNEGHDFWDSFGVPIWDGAYKAFLPTGEYWVAFRTEVMGPVAIDAETVPLDFPSVSTRVHLRANDTEVEGRFYARPQGAPADVFIQLFPDGQKTYDLVPGTYDVWVIEVEPKWSDFLDTGDVGFVPPLVPPLFGVVTLPGGLVVDDSGEATVAVELQTATLEIDCDGAPLGGRAGFLPDGLPGEVSSWFSAGSDPHWGFRYAGEEVGFVAGSTGRLYVSAAGFGDCFLVAPVDHTLSPVGDALRVNVDLIDVTLDVRVDGAPPSDSYAASLFAIDRGSYTPYEYGVPPGDYLLTVREDGVIHERRVSIVADGTLSVDFQTRSVPVDLALTGGELPAYLDASALVRRIEDAGAVPEWNRIFQLEENATSVRLSDGTYSVEPSLYDDRFRHDGTRPGAFCLTVGDP